MIFSGQPFDISETKSRLMMRKNNREKILETARMLFPKYGYNGISIREIASKAKLTTGAIYFHFKNKKDIYKTICLEAIEILISSFREGINKKQTPNQKLISTFDSYLQFFDEHRDYYNILMEVKSDYESMGDSEKNEIVGKFSQLICIGEVPIKMGIEEGRFRDIDPRMLSVFLAATTEGMLQYKKLGVLDFVNITDSDFRKFMADIIGQGIEKKESEPF